MAHMLEITLGAMLAGVLVLVLRYARFERALRFWARALFVAAAIYVGFVLVGDAPTQWVLIEVGGLVLFTILAVMGLRYSPWVLAGAWFAHIAWDTLLHPQNTTFIPQWYPPLCIGFDLVVGTYIVFVYIRFHKNVTPNKAPQPTSPLTRRRV
jgi:hypothetical protein